MTWMDDKGNVKLDYRPVHTYTLTNDVAYIEPKARVYEWSSSTCRRTPRSPRARPGNARPAPAASRRSASTAGIRTTTPTRAWTPTSSTATTARRWFSTR